MKPARISSRDSSWRACLERMRPRAHENTTCLADDQASLIHLVESQSGESKLATWREFALRKVSSVALKLF